MSVAEVVAGRQEQSDYLKALFKGEKLANNYRHPKFADGVDNRVRGSQAPILWSRFELILVSKLLF